MPTLTQIVNIQSVGKETREFGTKVSGFIKGSEVGQARCDRCLHYSDDACNHPTVMADPQVSKNDHGDAVVEDGDCCKFWWPKEK